MSNTSSPVMQKFTAFIDKINYAALPSAVTERMRECFLDFVGISAFASANVDSSSAFRSAVKNLDTGNSATVIGDTRRYSYQYAALLNGALAHTLDFDDTYLAGTVHPGAPVIAATMAVAEEVDASGAEFIEALAAGYELTCRIAAALGSTAYDRGFHVTPVAGIFGAIAATAKLRKVGAEVITDAFGLAGSQAAGSMQYLENGGWNKRLHPGFAAHDALTSMAFAEAGVRGASSPIEGQYGVLNGYGNAPRPGLLTDQLGSHWTLVETAFKPYPSCRFTHSAVEAALELRDLVSSEMRATSTLRLRLSPKSVQVVGERLASKLKPQSIVDGQFSVYFQVAAAWIQGRSDWQSYELIGSAELEELTDRIIVEADPTIPIAGAELSIESQGKTLLKRIDEPLGELQRPMSWDLLEGKFLTMASPVYALSDAQMIAQRIKNLEQEKSMAQLIGLLRTGSQQ